MTQAKIVRRLGEVLVLVTAAAVMLTSAYSLSAKKTLWMDELATYYEATDPSLTNMLSAVRHMDGNPPLYPILMRLWTDAFGATELMLRLPTVIGLVVAMLTCWWVARPRFGFWPATLATLLVFLTPYDVLYHYAEARYYGLFLALFSLVVLAWHRLAAVEAPGGPLLAVNALLHAALVMTHTFGGLYAACVLAALVALDLRRGRRRWRVWASFVIGWSVFIPWIPSFLAQRELGRPHGWITMPTLDQTVRAFNYGLGDSLPIMVLLAAGAVLLGRRTEEASDQERAHWTPTVGLALTVVILPPLVALAVSHLVVPVFLPRYLLPGLVGFLLLFAGLLARAGVARVRGALGKTLLLAAAAFALTTPLRMVLATPPSFVRDLPAIEDEGVPVVTEDPQVYLPLHHYHSHERLWIVVDWESCLDERAHPTAVNNYRLMKAMARHYPVHNVIEGSELLERFDEMLFIETDYYLWSERTVRPSPEWRVEPVGPRVFRVSRRPQ